MMYALFDHDDLVMAFGRVDTVGIIHHPDLPNCYRVDGEEPRLAQSFSGHQLLRIGAETSIPQNSDDLERGLGEATSKEMWSGRSHHGHLRCHVSRSTLSNVTRDESEVCYPRLVGEERLRLRQQCPPELRSFTQNNNGGGVSIKSTRICCN